MSETMVQLVTVDPTERVERVVPLGFAYAQLGCGYQRVTISDPETGIVMQQESNS